MPILNYTTEVAVDKTVTEIQKMLMKANAKRIMIEYEKQTPSAMVFELDGQPYMLPCRVDAVHKLLQKETRIKPGQRSREQAERVAWRILKTWIAAQLAIFPPPLAQQCWRRASFIETGMVALDEVMMPYQVVRPGQTMYEVYREERADRLLPQNGAQWVPGSK